MKLFQDIDVAGKVLPLEQVRLFADFPAEWSLTGLSPQDQKAIIRQGEESLLQPVPELSAGLYRQFGRTGNRSQFEDAYMKRRRLLHDLLYAEAVERKGRFLDRIVDLAWALLEESTWVLPAHNGGQLCGEFGEDIHNVDLFSGVTAGLLALSLQLLGERLDEGLPNHLLTRRMRYEIHRRLLLPISRYDMPWMCRYANNWNPWIFSNALFSLTVCEDDPDFREALVARILEQMDHFVGRYGESGGCDEGPSYWGVAGGCFFDCLELLYDLTAGRIDLFGSPFVRRMGEYIMKMHICGNYFVTFADAPHRFTPEGVMIARFGRRTGGGQLEAFGLSLAEKQDRPPILMASSATNVFNTCYRAYKNMVYWGNMPAAEAFSYSPCQYIDDIQVMTARQSPYPDRGLFAAIKGGHNDESHNHNDVGNFIVYYNGEPFLIDAGVDTYSRTTFSAQRYSLWYMQSSYHNLPDINGFAQRPGKAYQASDVRFDPERRELSLELSGAYPEEAGIESFRRTLRLDDERVTVSDTFCLGRSGRVEEHYLFHERPDLSVPGRITIPGGPVVQYNPRLSATCEEVSLLIRVDLAEGQSPRGSMANNWGRDVLFRVSMVADIAGEETFELSVF